MGERLSVTPYPLGAHKEENGVRFAFVSNKTNCGILLYDRKSGIQKQKIPFLPEDKYGNIYCKYVKNMDTDAITYQFYEDDEQIPDPYARSFVEHKKYGSIRNTSEMYACISQKDFDWKEDVTPKIPYHDCICYCLHVRGFTIHSSSKVKNKGTFLGLTEKIPYLKECGITTIELQPVYEFLELKECQKDEYGYLLLEEKLNYWGYTKGYYYAPKASYSKSEDSITEFKEMVKSFHDNKMEVVLQFYFPKEIKAYEMLEILRFWVLNYHVDGFHLMGENLPSTMLAQDPLLADTKLWYYRFDDKIDNCNLAIYQDDYLYDMRRFLKGDEGMLSKALYHMRTIPSGMGRIHFFSNYYGMTLMDMVTYDRKHNENNGENNLDGSDYNCSWNCGEEGASRKKKVQKLRMKQLKNAFCMLLFSQSTPLIFMGDEFGNSQKGNNNPYCQDNEITWLNWKDLEKNKELFSFYKKLVWLRKNHPIFHLEKEPRLMDYLCCGYPDLSYHGENAWQPQLEGYQRQVGILYCGHYAALDTSKETDSFFYLGINMHWEPCTLALPRLPKGYKWKYEFTTCDEKEASVCDSGLSVEENLMEAVAPRSISFYVSIPER